MKISVTFTIDVDEQGQMTVLDQGGLQLDERTLGFREFARSGDRATPTKEELAEVSLADLTAAASILNNGMDFLSWEIDNDDSLSEDQKQAKRDDLSQAIDNANAAATLKLVELLSQNSATVQKLATAAANSKEAAEKSLKKLKRIAERIDDLTAAVNTIAKIIGFF